MNAHTPGPWRVESGTTLIWGNCDPDDTTSYDMGYPVADAQHPQEWRPSQPTDAEIDANCALIAAAPDLLVALQLLVADVADYEPWQRPCHALDVALAAIAKATP